MAEAVLTHSDNGSTDPAFSANHKCTQVLLELMQFFDQVRGGAKRLGPLAR